VRWPPNHPPALISPNATSKSADADGPFGGLGVGVHQVHHDCRRPRTDRDGNEQRMHRMPDGRAAQRVLDRTRTNDLAQQAGERIARLVQGRQPLDAIDEGVGRELGLSTDEAARAMRERDIGDVVVTEGPTLAGVVTDRDIAVRCVAQGLAGDRTQLEQILSANVRFCREDQTVDEAVEMMQAAGIRRLPVVDSAGHTRMEATWISVPVGATVAAHSATHAA